MRNKRNHNRLEQITHYVIARMPTEQLGTTKLAKIMWLADIISWRRYAEALTGIEGYRRLPHGPVPTQVRAVLTSLVENEVILERTVDFYGGRKKELISLKEPDLSCLSAEDVDILHRAMDIIGPMSAREVSEASHDVYWQEVPEDGVMSVGAASILPGDVDQEDIDWAEGEIVRLGIGR